MARRGWRLLLAVAGVMGMVVCAPNRPELPQSGATLATVNGTAITAGELELLATVGPPRLKARLQSAIGRTEILNDLIDRELLYRESLRRGLDRDPQLRAQIAMNQRTLIATAALQAEITAAAQRYYDTHAEEFSVIPLHHLLIRFGAGAPRGGRARTEADALKRITALKARIAAGEAFGEVVHAASEDSITKGNGGLLGKISRREPRLMRRGYGELLDTAFALEPATVAGPFKTAEGYHLLFSAAPASLQPFAQVAPEIAMRVRDDARSAFLKQLRDHATIVVHDIPKN